MMFGLGPDKRVIYETKIGMIGLGKLGMPCAEAIASKGFDVAGYDIAYKTSNLIEMREDIEDLCRDRDIVFLWPHQPHTKKVMTEGVLPAIYRYKISIMMP